MALNYDVNDEFTDVCRGIDDEEDVIVWLRTQDIVNLQQLCKIRGFQDFDSVPFSMLVRWLILWRDERLKDNNVTKNFYEVSDEFTNLLEHGATKIEIEQWLDLQTTDSLLQLAINRQLQTDRITLAQLTANLITWSTGYANYKAGRYDESLGITMRVVGCARCGQNHKKLTFVPFVENPIIIDGMTYNFTALCPVYNEPIVMRIGDKKFATAADLRALYY